MSAEDATTQCVPAVLKTARILDLVALGQRTDPGAPFLIRGEPGVGKDVLARLIHAASERQRYSFIKVNCAVRPAGRCEADLFGHDKGASPWRSGGGSGALSSPTMARSTWTRSRPSRAPSSPGSFAS